MLVLFIFFFNDASTTEIYTLSLNDALPISTRMHLDGEIPRGQFHFLWPNLGVNIFPGRPNISLGPVVPVSPERDRKSTRLNSSHTVISYAVFCLKKKKKKTHQTIS